MNTEAALALIGGILALTAALIVVALTHRRHRQMMRRLNSMLDNAIAGSFIEEDYDESALSALETKMSRYLAAGAASAQNLRAEREKIETLVADISHQTKTPIANILLYAQLLAERERPAEDAVCVEALSAQAAKLNFLIGALVKASRLETGIIAVTPQTEAVSALLAAVADSIRPGAADKNIELIVDGSPGAAQFDLKWTAEALYNIADNAVKYSPPGAAVTLSARPYDLFFRLDIADEGPGIAEAEHGKIFHRFYRSPAVADREGVGLGLFLAREIITAQGGYIKLASTPGQGAVFSVFLPR